MTCNRDKFLEALYAVDNAVNTISSIVAVVDNPMLDTKAKDDLLKVVPLLAKQALKTARNIGKEDACCGKETCCKGDAE